ncbi:MAG TPA: TonB family protein, partial [Opitutaceae bacterium]|nr:TonB family protein [Opitutaceae bacterium]
LEASAQFGPPAYEPMKANQTDLPAFPQTALVQGFKAGQVRVAVQIDADGRLTDYVVTAYTSPAFVDGAVAAVKNWRFEPARIHGAPRSAKAEFTFNYEAQGVVVVDMSIQTMAELLHLKIVPNSLAFSACTLGQLDRIPTPIKIVKPDYPNSLARSSRGGHVTVEFYIDEKGHVRLASVDRQTIEANEELAAAAVTAVEQWQFEPPLLRGRPALTLAQQDFNFKSPAP